VWLATKSLFVWFISHQPTVFFSQNKSATSNQYFSLTTNQHQPPTTSHQPNEQAASCPKT
jgi:hypothetical protein